MKVAFNQALKIYKYASLLFSIGYWIYIIIDDYHFIERYWKSNWLEYLGLWILYFVMYFIAFSFYFWIAALATVLIYVKVMKPLKEERVS